MAENCIFCAIADRTAAAEVVGADAHTIAFLDINPATRGHTLVIPRSHSENLLTIPVDDLHRVTEMAQRIAARMPDALGAAGVNLINSCGAAAWQTVSHFHLHVVPRYEDDPLRLPWVPAPASSEDLAHTAELLR
ncbi:MAG: HIT domain-containing protein [Solirubrobacterales bacterium]